MKPTLLLFGIFSSLLISCASVPKVRPALVLTTDFGEADGAVSAMKGVARATAPDVLVSDLTHLIPPYKIWDAAYRLDQTFRYWPEGTVFVTVVDPGVGSDRKSIALKTKSGHVFVGPDNGLFTFISEDGIAETDGQKEIYQIDETKQRLKGSEDSYTFHGRDLYVYVGARLASGQVAISDLGSRQASVLQLPYQKPEVMTSETGVKTIHGVIPVLDPNYGNVWTNIPQATFQAAFSAAGEPNSSLPKKFRVKIPKAKYDRVVTLETTFSGVKKGEPLLYFNSLLNLSIALNQGNFSEKHKIESGPLWQISIEPHR